MTGRTARNVEQYIDGFPPAVQRMLRGLRAAIRGAAPDALEKISYGMPAYWQKRILIYFAGHARHIGLYPGTEAVIAFQKDLARYVTSKGTIQFPYDRPIPLGLVRRIVGFRVRACAPASRSPGKRSAPRAARSGSGRRKSPARRDPPRQRPR